MAAAFLDFPNTRELANAVVRGEAPCPSALRGASASREPVWNRADLETFLAGRAPSNQDAPAKPSLASLV